MQYADLEAALKIFAISSPTSLAQIKATHKKLVKQYHPDTGCTDNDKIRLINSAYKILEEYCLKFNFTFSHDEFMEQNPEERLRQQFANESFWKSPDET
ncbi:MAG: DnaJ domain-containing protein [Desulfuromonas sp.]|nr:DnaJ domain-containing protein [Desulfuromonas sp.]